MKWGKGHLPEGEGFERKPETVAEEHEGEEKHEETGVVPDENCADQDDTVIASRDGKEENTVGKTPQGLQPSRSLVRKKWLLTAARKREASLPHEATPEDDKDHPDSGDSQRNDATRKSGNVLGSRRSREHPSTSIGGVTVAETKTEFCDTQGTWEKQERQVEITTSQKRLPKSEGTSIENVPASLVRTTVRSPQEKKEAQENGQTEEGIREHQDSSPSNQKACLVCVRVRPESLQEISAGGTLCVDTRHAAAGTVTISGYRDRQYSFHFDHVFDQDATQEAVYRSTCESLLEKLMAGYSASVMAYGQTGAGKTYTMLGEIAEWDFHRALTDPTTRGLVPRLLEAIFERILRETTECNENGGGASQESTEESFKQRENGKPTVTFSVRASLVEIYNDNVRDLLAPTRDFLQIRNGNCTSHSRLNNSAVLTEATEVPVATAQEAFALIYTGFSHRAHGTTLLNEKSSRSHAIFQLIIRRNSVTACRVTCSRLCLVDLAGSERVSKADSSGATLREAQSINKSLLALGNVITAIPQSQKNGQKTHVPYRNSKLTRLLQHSFGGHTFKVLLLCCSPHNFNVKETLSTLRFGDRAANLKSEPLSVETLDPELLLQRLHEAQTELRILRAQIRAYVVQTARHVDALKMLQTYLPQDVTLTEDHQALLKHALQELPVLTQEERLQLRPPISASSTANRGHTPKAQPNISPPGAQRKGPSSPKALESTHGQKRPPHDMGRADRTREYASTRPRTAPQHPPARPPTSTSQRGSPSERRPLDQKRIQATQAAHPEAGKKNFPAAKESPLEKPPTTQTGRDNREVPRVAEAGAAERTPDNNAALTTPAEKEETCVSSDKIPAIVVGYRKEDGENGPQDYRRASKGFTEGGHPAVTNDPASALTT